MIYTPRPDATPEERLAMVEVVACDIHHRLFGNGQPGEIEKNRAEAERNRDEAERKIDGLRKELDGLKKRVYPASAVMGVLGAIIGALVKGFFGR